jgi:hypothetical protein
MFILLPCEYYTLVDLFHIQLLIWHDICLRLRHTSTDGDFSGYAQENYVFTIKPNNFFRTSRWLYLCEYEFLLRKYCCVFVDI